MKIVRDNSILIIKVTENPIINRVVFEGNKEIEDDILEAEVSLKPRNLFTRARIQDDVERILTLYRSEGSFSSKVTPKIISLPQNRVDVVFEIYEGENTIINSITFNGNTEWQISLAKGKKTFDKRESIKAKDIKRDIDRLKKIK